MKYLSNFKKFFIIIVACFLSGCVYLPKYKAVAIDDIVFYNETNSPMYDVVLYVPGINKKVLCTYLGGKKEFATNYPVDKFQGNSIELTWTSKRKRWHKGPIQITMPEHITLEKPTQVFAVLGADGKADIFFKQK